MFGNLVGHMFKKYPPEGFNLFTIIKIRVQLGV